MDVPNAFIGKSTQPTPADVSTTLGPAASLWADLVDWSSHELGATNQEWKSSSPKYGWTLILSFKKRRIVYLTPCSGCFCASFILGDRAVAAARQAGLSKPLLKLLDEATHYPEGTGLRLMVKVPKDLVAVRKVAQLKLAN